MLRRVDIVVIFFHPCPIATRLLHQARCLGNALPNFFGVTYDASFGFENFSGLTYFLFLFENSLSKRCLVTIKPIDPVSVFLAAFFIFIYGHQFCFYFYLFFVFVWP